MAYLCNETGCDSSFHYNGREYLVKSKSTILFSEEIITHYQQHVNGPLKIVREQENLTTETPFIPKYKMEELNQKTWKELLDLAMKEGVYHWGTSKEKVIQSLLKL